MRDFCAFTIVQNEDIFLEIWTNYYSKHIEPQDIFILNHDSSTESSLKKLYDLSSKGFNVIPVHRSESFNHTWLKDTVCRFQQFLLQSYKVVLFAECDELLITKENYTNHLTEYLQQASGKPHHCCCAYELVHYKDEEDELNLDKPILAQRNYWHRTPIYDKPLITNRPIEWVEGFHSSTNEELPLDIDLFLVHIHRIDYNLCKKKHQEQASRKWSEKDLEEKKGFQNRIFDGEEFDKWFYTTIGPKYDLPPHIKNAI